MQSPACKVWIPSEELKTLLEMRRSKRHGYAPIFQTCNVPEEPGNSSQAYPQSAIVKEVEGSLGGLYSAELTNQGILAMLQEMHILAEVGQEALRRGCYRTRQETHIFALVSSRQRHTVYPNGLALTTHPELDKFSNHGFEVVEVKLPPSDKPSLDQFVMEAHAVYKALTLQQSLRTQTGLNGYRDPHILFYTANAQRS